jgi:hypothetical protein
MDVTVGVAALASWLLTAGSGAYLLGTWIVGGGIHLMRGGTGGLPPTVVFGHFGLAVAGLRGRPPVRAA